MRRVRKLCISLLTAVSASAQILALTGGTIWVSPAEEPIRKGTVVIDNGRIASVGRGRVRVPRGARVLDCSGLTILEQPRPFL